MKGDREATTKEAYLDSLPPDRRADVERLDALIREAAPGLTPGYANGFLGYGPYHYRYASGREGDAFKIAVASQKQHLALYGCGTGDQGLVAERYRERLPKASIGKGCVRFKRLDDLDQAALRDLIQEAARRSMDGT